MNLRHLPLFMASPLYQSNHGTAGNREAGGFVNSPVTWWELQMEKQNDWLFSRSFGRMTFKSTSKRTSKLSFILSLYFGARNVSWCPLITTKTRMHSNTVADPGFSPGGGANSQNCYYFSHFCRKLHENERIWTPRGGRASLAPPLGSANAIGFVPPTCQLYLFRTVPVGMWFKLFSSRTSFQLEDEFLDTSEP